MLTATGEVFTGCNVENVSYGLTMCAERVAIGNAVASDGPQTRIVELAVSSPGALTCTPRGACRQVIAELGPGALVRFHESGHWRELTIAQLLPLGFDRDEP